MTSRFSQPHIVFLGCRVPHRKLVQLNNIIVSLHLVTNRETVTDFQIEVPSLNRLLERSRNIKERLKAILLGFVKVERLTTF
jgi:hypothetical protein